MVERNSIEKVMELGGPRSGGRLDIADATYNLMHEEPQFIDVSLRDFDVWLANTLQLEIPEKLREDLGFDALIWKGLLLKNGNRRYLLGFSKEDSNSPSIDTAQGLIEVPFVIPSGTTDISPEKEIPSLAFSGVTMDSSGQIRSLGIRYFLNEEREARFCLSLSEEELPEPFDKNERATFGAHTELVPFYKELMFRYSNSYSWKTGALITEAMVKQTIPRHTRVLLFTQYQTGDTLFHFGERFSYVKAEKMDTEWKIMFLMADQTLSSWEMIIPRLIITEG